MTSSASPPAISQRDRLATLSCDTLRGSHATSAIAISNSIVTAVNCISPIVVFFSYAKVRKIGKTCKKNREKCPKTAK